MDGRRAGRLKDPPKFWRKEIGKLKTERSAGTVPLIDPLRSLLERHRAESPDGFILQNSSGKPLDMDSINTRIITPALEKAGIEWAGFYLARRGISSLVAAVSNPLTSSGILRNSLAVNLKDYQEPSEGSKSAVCVWLKRWPRSRKRQSNDRLREANR